MTQPSETVAPAVPTYTYTLDQIHGRAANCAAVPGVTPGPTATVVLASDTPAPRCAVVRLDQRLAVVNPQNVGVVVSLGRLRRQIAAHTTGLLAIRQARLSPGGYLMTVVGRGHTGGDTVGVIVHDPSTARFDDHGHRVF